MNKPMKDKYFASQWIKEQTKRIRDMEKELEKDEKEMEDKDIYFDEGYINGSYYMLAQIKKLLRREEL